MYSKYIWLITDNCCTQNASLLAAAAAGADGGGGENSGSSFKENKTNKLRNVVCGWNKTFPLEATERENVSETQKKNKERG